MNAERRNDVPKSESRKERRRDRLYRRYKRFRIKNIVFRVIEKHTRMNVMRNPKRARPTRVPATAPTIEPADKPELGDAVETALIVVDGTSEIELVNPNINGLLFTVAEKAVYIYI